MERIEMIYMIAFRSMIKALREGQTPRPYAMLFRSRTAAVMDIQAINLSEAYLKNAGGVAQRRAVQAAYRLAEVWRMGTSE